MAPIERRMWYEPDKGSAPARMMDRIEGRIESHEVGPKGHIIKLARRATTFVLHGAESGDGEGLTLFPQGTRVILHSLDHFPDERANGEHQVLGMETINRSGHLIAFTRSNAGYVLRGPNEGEKPGEVIVASGASLPEGGGKYRCR